MTEILQEDDPDRTELHEDLHAVLHTLREKYDAFQKQRYMQGKFV